MLGLSAGLVGQSPSVGILGQVQGGPAPLQWSDPAFNKRLSFSMPNSSGVDLHDHLVTVAIPAGTTIDSGSLRAVEATSLSTIDRAFDWRYTSSSLNHLPYLPLSISGSNVTFKVLGRWQAGETRYFHLYWNSAGGSSQLDYKHLDAIAPTWTALAVAGTAGDIYRLIVNGTTYSYTMVGGDSATVIATALKNLINAGTDATATSSTGTVSITRTGLHNLTFTVVNTGTTVPANLAVTKPIVWTLGRTGPDTGSYAPGTFAFGVPYSIGGVIALRTSFGSKNSGVYARMMQYKANGDGTGYVANDGTVTSFNNDGPTNTVAGAATFAQRAGGVDWAATYTATHQHRFYVGRKSDDTGPHSLTKYVDVMRVSLVYTCQRAYTPAAVLNSATAVSNSFDMITLASTVNVFTSNVTEAAGNKIANFSAPASTGVITSFAASADLSALPVTGTILGTHGNTNGVGILVNSCVFAGFGSQSPVAHWAANSNPFAVLQAVNLTTASQIPLNATITLDFWLVSGYTNNSTAGGDNLLPDEVVDIIRNLTYAPTPTFNTNTAETYRASGLYLSALQASIRAVAGVLYFQTNGAADTSVAGNYAYQKQVRTGVVATPDDDDGNYGEAHKLHGLCLRYLRTHEASLITLIENQVSFHIQIETGAVAAYGSWWNGSAPFWYWPSATPSGGGAYTLEGGIAGGDTDPTFNGGVKGPITYTQGQIRRQTSIDQMHMVAHGLYAYLYLLRNETAITANTMLRTNALNLVSRMVTFEAAHFVASARLVDNLYAILTSATATNANGITPGFENAASALALATPYYGTGFGLWNVSNGTSQQLPGNANSSLDSFFRSVFAPNGDNLETMRFLKGRVMDMLVQDLSRHDVVSGGLVAGTGIIGAYGAGWNTRTAVPNNTAMYATPRTVASNNGFSSDLHYIQINDAGGRDHMSGRAAQRLCVMVLMAMFDPTWVVPVEMNGATVLRSIPILTAVDDQARALLSYVIEPTTQAQRFAVSGYLGNSTNYNSQIVDSTATGYWMMAVELYLMSRSLLPTYYKFPGV